MAGSVKPSKDGYTIRGILPPALRMESDDVKLTFWSHVVAEGLREKDRELSRGLDAEGRPLKPIAPETRKHRRSAMTPTGKGDPSAPPLTPGRALSRTRSLLAGRAFPDRAEFWWRYDPLTYDSWARILRDQKRKGRDVFGLSPAGLARVTARSWRALRPHAAGQARRRHAAARRPAAPAAAPQVLPMVGSTRMTYATTGIGAEPHAPGARTTGGLPWEKWLAFLRRPAAPPAGMVPTRRPFNELLGMIFGPTRSPSPPPMPPKPKPMPAPAPKGAVPFRKPRPIPMAAAPLPTPTPSPIPAAAAAPRSRAERMAISADWRASLVGVERSAVVDYTGGTYRAVNHYLRTGEHLEGPMRKTPGDVATSIHHVDRALAKARLDGGLRVFRGVEDLRALGLDPDNLVGAEITDAGYLSTSLDKDRGRSFVRKRPGGAILRIAAPAGSPGAYVAPIANLEGEQEVLFARGLTLRIAGSHRDKEGILIIDAELLHGR